MVPRDLQCQDTGSIPSPARWIKKDPMVLQLQCSCHLQLGSDLWPWTPLCLGAAKKKKKKNVCSEHI